MNKKILVEKLGKHLINIFKKTLEKRSALSIREDFSPWQREIPKTSHAWLRILPHEDMHGGIYLVQMHGDLGYGVMECMIGDVDMAGYDYTIRIDSKNYLWISIPDPPMMDY